MNRYTMAFAVLMAASFAVHAPRGGDPASQEAGHKKLYASKRPGPQPDEPVAFIKDFVAKETPTADAKGHNPQVLIATVSHPTETHLAAAFDSAVEATQDGLQAAGYIFDSAWIPWKSHEPRDAFDDDRKEDESRGQEDSLPGVMLFRHKQRNPYSDGLVVFLVTEKPTQGISRTEIDAIPKILSQAGIAFGDSLRILGPRFSGSFASLAPAAGDLLAAAPEAKRILLRSGSVTGGHAAACAVEEISAAWPRVKVDFGSTSHDYEDRIQMTQATLERLGITKQHTAILAEGESLYGDMYAIAEHEEEKSAEHPNEKSADDEEGKNAGAARAQSACGVRTAQDRRRHLDIAGMWRIHFPRDISSVRTGYQNQGLFETGTQPELTKRFLNLKNEDQGEGDSVRTFGGAETMGAKEGVLFGISEFLKKHEIQAVIIQATNEQDRFFVSQFLHVNNGGVRQVILDPTRVFLRGATAQFRGDMFVGEFPLLPLLHDWTGNESDRAGHIFPDDVSQGTYFAAIDLAADETRRANWAREYSEPDWNGDAAVQRPPLYVVALGSSATWPVGEAGDLHFTAGGGAQGRVEMPFTLFAHSVAGATPAGATPVSRIRAGRFWRTLLSLLILLTGLYCVAIWYSNSIASGTFASFEPVADWRYWLFKITVPGAAAGGAFAVMAWTVRLPATAGEWYLAETFSVLAPLAITASAIAKALAVMRIKWNRGMLAAALPPAVALAALIPAGALSHDPFSGRDVAAMLDTFREMHWESGLSLIPTGLLLLLGLFFWASEAGNGAATLNLAPPMPTFSRNSRISDVRGRCIVSAARPCPLNARAKWLWIGWGSFIAIVLFGHFGFQAFEEITTLESKAVTEMVFVGATILIALMLFDLMQFLWVWIDLRALMRAVAREPFKRSFVPIKDFNWRSLWTFTGISFGSRRAINTAQIDCLLELASTHGLTALKPAAETLQSLRSHYNGLDLRTVERREFANNHQLFFSVLRHAADGVALLLEHRGDPAPPREAAENNPPYVLVCNCSKDEGPYSDEKKELANLPAWQRSAEQFICLMYIGFIQSIVARLHTLLISVACMFSAVALAIAIYPFQPLSPMVFAAVLLLALIGWAFFKVFSEMDTDPILSRIVNGDDSKLQGSFYTKLAESLALPLLTLASSLLPGGAGRLLELAQTLFNHGQ